MTKKFTQSILLVILLNLLVKPVWIFAIDRSIQNRVGAEQYGIYFSLFGFSVIFNIIADLGITNFNNRNIAQNHHHLNAQIASLIPLRIILGGIYIIVSLFFAFFFGYSKYQIYLLTWLIINQLIISFTLYLRSNISGLQQFNTDSFISVIDKLLLIIICSFLLWSDIFNHFKIEWFIYAQTFSYFISFIISLIIVLKHSKKIKFKLKFKFSIDLLKKSFPYATLIFLMAAYTRIDAVMLERILPDGKSQAGVYAQAFRIVDALSMFAYLFAGILLPLFARMIKEKKPFADILSHSINMLIIPSIGLIIAVFINSKNFMALLYLQNVNESSIILQFLIIGYLGICISYIYGTLLTASGNLKILNRTALAGLAINIILNVFLIPRFEAFGASATNMFTQLAMGFTQMYLSYKLFTIKVTYIIFLKYCMLIILLIGFAILLKVFHQNWIISICSIPAISVGIGFPLKLIRFENFSQLLTAKQN